MDFDWSILLNQIGTIVTVLTAIVAYVVYRISKEDELVNAVRSLILEIRESERIIKELIDIKNSSAEYPEDFIPVIPGRVWSKYSHYFIGRLNNDEYEHISSYYRKCEVIEKFLEKNYNFFWITTEERARQKEKIGAELAVHEPSLDNQAFQMEIEAVAGRYFRNTAPYKPTGIKTEMDRALSSVVMVTTTPTWNKLKQIGKYSDLLG